MEEEIVQQMGLASQTIKSSSNSNTDDFINLMELQSADASRSKIWMMGFHHQQNNINSQFGGGGGGSGGGGPGGGGGGPTGSNSSGANEVVGHTYYDNVSSPRFGGENFTRDSTNSQPFDIFAASHSTTTPYKSPEGIMAASVAFPFTSAQWKELERQAMIYKYMISSVPVPPDLLFPLSRNFPAVDSSLSSMYNVRYSRNGDPEPGRCKRTDGKKWRCSRDVAPHQKYCERHLHRGRPRSRKPVEVKNNGESNKKTRVEHTNLPNSHFAALNDKPLFLFHPKTDLHISNAPCFKGASRDLGLTMEAETVVTERSIGANMGFVNEGCSIFGSASLFHQDFVEQNPLDVLSYSNFPATEIEAPITGYIDAWSMDNLNSSNAGNVETSVPTDHRSLSPSLNLSIAMAAGSVSDQEMASIKCFDEQSIKDSRCFNPVSWEPFARGGPLAEALPALGCKNPASPHESISTVATTVSSPTGVLHRALFSQSDGSGCSSPTLAAPTSEVAFRWLI